MTARCILVAAVLGCLSCAGSAARADVRLTAEVRVSRTGGSASSTPPADEPTTASGLFQGERVRIETGDSVVIFDLAAKRVYRLNAANKTYAVLTLHDFLAQSRAGAGYNRPAEFVDSSLKADLVTDLKKDAVVDPKTFAGHQARLFNLTEVVTLRQDVDETDTGRGTGGGFPGGRGGRRGRGGGFPGGGGGAPRERRPQNFGGAQVVGEVWLAADVSPKLHSKHFALPLFVLEIPSEPALMAISDKIAKAGGFPLSAKITTTWRASRPGADTGASTTVTMDVTDISEAPLDAGLFRVPADYSKAPGY